MIRSKLIESSILELEAVVLSDRGEFGARSCRIGLKLTYPHVWCVTERLPLGLLQARSCVSPLKGSQGSLDRL
jgi:hypothetical protein